MAEFSVRDHPQASRYELWVDDELVSIADYTRHEDVVTVPHVETRRDLRGLGNSDQLMQGVLDDLRARGLRIRPICPHFVTYLRDHPEESDLVV